MGERSPAKDALAKAIIYGGTSAAQFLVCTAGVAAGFVDKDVAKGMSKMASKLNPHYKRKAWEKYQRTGDIWTMFDADD